MERPWIGSALLQDTHRCPSGKNMPDTATLSSKFQISIPKAVREAQGWKAGQELAFIPDGRGVRLVAVPKREEMFGIAKGAESEDIRDRRDRY
jgi:AbrB family looped-hinge helix DNA binding protein